MLIKRRCFRGHHKDAKNVLPMLHERNLMPDIVTFGVLATGCRTWENGRELVADMKAAGFRPNVEVIGAMVSNASLLYQFWYLIDLMNLMKDEGIQPDPHILERLEQAYQNCRKDIIDYEKNMDKFNPNDRPSYHEAFKVFSMYYPKWLKAVQVLKDEHPWAQYGYTERVKREQKELDGSVVK
jgi:Ribonuclease G/E